MKMFSVAKVCPWKCCRVSPHADTLGLHIARPDNLGHQVGGRLLLAADFHDAEVPETDLHRIALVNLQGDHALTRNRGIRLGVFQQLDSVDGMGDTCAVRPDLVVVPIRRFDGLGDHFRIGRRQDPAAAGLIKQVAVFSGCEVRLITGYLVGVRDAFGAVQEARVPLAVHELDLEPEDKVLEGPRGGQEIVLIHARRASDNRTVLDSPKIGVPFPAVEILAVEQRNEPRLVLRLDWYRTASRFGRPSRSTGREPYQHANTDQLGDTHV